MPPISTSTRLLRLVATYRVVVVALWALAMVGLSATSVNAKPISEGSPTLFEVGVPDGAGPAVRLTLGGLSGDFLRGDVRLTAELTTGLTARVFVVVDDWHVVVESTVVRWRASISFGGWRPLTNLTRLAERMMSGMQAVHGAISYLPEVLESMEASSDRMRPWGRPLRIASEALDSLWNATPGWTVGVSAMGRVWDPLGMQLDPLYEVAATATLIF